MHIDILIYVRLYVHPWCVFQNLIFPDNQEELLSLFHCGTGDKSTKFSVTVTITYTSDDDIQLILALLASNLPYIGW